MSFDAIVVGSGMSGLTAAIILAKEGMRVRVLEQHYRAGGYLHRFFRKGKVSFDVGFHYIGGAAPDRVLGRYLSYCGVLDRLELVPLDPDGYDRVLFPDFEFRIPSGEERLRQRLHDGFPGEAAAVDRYVDTMREVVAGFGFYNLVPEVDPKHVARWSSTSIGELLDEIGVSSRLRSVLTAQHPLYGSPPRRAPVALHALATDSFLQGTHVIRGGGDALAQAMVARLRELGGEVKTRRRVERILVDDQRRVRGVETDDGEVHEAPRVISCAHPKATVRMLPEAAVRKRYRERVLGMEDGCGMLSSFLTTEADLSRYAKNNTYVYDTEQYDELYEVGDGSHRFAFVTVPSAREGVTAAGHHLAIGLGLLHWDHVARWADSRTGSRGESYERFKADQSEDLRRLMARAVPELVGDLVASEAATPLTNRDYTESERGAAYGLHHVVGQMGRHGLRPRTRVGGLLLTGQSVLLPGVLGVTISAFLACSEILGAEYLMGKVKAES